MKDKPYFQLHNDFLRERVFVYEEAAMNIVHAQRHYKEPCKE